MRLPDLRFSRLTRRNAVARASSHYRVTPIHVIRDGAADDSAQIVVGSEVIEMGQDHRGLWKAFSSARARTVLKASRTHPLTGSH